MKNKKNTSLKEMLIEYIFAMIGFFLGMLVSAFLLSMIGVRAYSEYLHILLSEVGGALAAMFAFVRSEANRTDRRIEFHKELDDGGERDAFRFGAILKQLRMPYDLIFAILLPVVFVRYDFSRPVSAILNLVVGVLLIMVIRLLAIFIARKKWAKEHIKK